MTTDDVEGNGTPTDPWQLTTPPGSSAFEAFRDPDADPPALVVQVGKTQLRYHLSCIEDLHGMLTDHGDWMPLGNADEQKPATDGTVEAWGRSAANPVGGWYGFKKGLRGRFGNYVPPVLEALGLAEVEHNARNNRMRAIRRADEWERPKMSTVVVRYRTIADQADENQRLVEGVFAALASKQPEGLRYITLRLADGTFVHIADVTADSNPLSDLDAFAAFTAGVAERCEPGEGPNPQPATVVGSYGFPIGAAGS